MNESVNVLFKFVRAPHPQKLYLLKSRETTILNRPRMYTRTKLSEEDLALIEVAKDTSERLRVDDVHEVAAALRTKDKEIFTGIHIEAKVGFADVCGEVAAICHALAHGHRDYEAIVALKETGDGEYRILAPCGRCREVISDFSKDIWVILGTLEEPFKVMVSDLLPMK